MSDRFFQTTFGPSVPAALNLISGQTNGVTARQERREPERADRRRRRIVHGDRRRRSHRRHLLVVQAHSGHDGRPQHRRSARRGERLVGLVRGGIRRHGRQPERHDRLRARRTRRRSRVWRRRTTSRITSRFSTTRPPPISTHVRPTSVATIGTKGDAANHQYDLADFFAALDAGHFPAVAFLKPAAYQNGHAGYSDPIDEQAFLVRVLNDLQQRPEWKSTAVFLTWDDSDGWYDHLMGPIVNSSVGPVDALDGDGVCGDGKAILPGHLAGDSPRARAMRLRAAPAAARDLAVGEAQLRRFDASPTSRRSCASSKTSFSTAVASAADRSTRSPARSTTCSTSRGRRISRR